MFPCASRPKQYLLVVTGVAAAVLALFLLCWPRLAWATSTSTDEVSPATSAPTNGPVVADLGIYSDYIARGLSYSRERYSVQGHLEYDSQPGLYAGAWLIHNSEIVNKETIEFDPYAGYLRRYGNWTVDVGATAWLYPHSRLDVSRNRYNTLEATVDVSYEMVGVKFWYDTRNFFGLDSSSARPDYGLEPGGSSQGSVYIDSHANLPLPGGLLLKLHVGHQIIHHYAQLNYTDWLLGVERPLPGHLTLGAAYTDTNADAALWVDGHGLELGRAKWLAYLRWGIP